MSKITRLQVLLANLPHLDLNLPNTLQTFTLFLNLPIELRDKIWGFVALHPRQVRLCEYIAQAYRPGMGPPKIEQYPIPPLLHTCQHSREEGLRYYELCKERDGVYLYINFSVDIFAFPKTINMRSASAFQVYATIPSFNFTSDALARIIYVNITDDNETGLTRRIRELKLLWNVARVRKLDLIMESGGASGEDIDMYQSLANEERAKLYEETVEAALLREENRAWLLETVTSNVINGFHDTCGEKWDIDIEVKWKEACDVGLLP